MQIETPVAARQQLRTRIERNSSLNWLVHAGGPDDLGENGFRPVDMSVLAEVREAVPAATAAVQDRLQFLGGWDKVNTKFFDPTNGIMAKIEQSLGVATG